MMNFFEPTYVLLLVVIMLVIFRLLAWVRERRNCDALQIFLKRAKVLALAQEIQGARYSARWWRGFPVLVLSFPTDAALARARDSGAVARLVDQLVRFVHGDAAHGNLRHRYTGDHAVLLGVEGKPVEPASDRSWWQQDLVGGNAIPLGPEIRALVDELMPEHERDEAALRLLHDCGANVALPGTDYQRIAEVEEAVRFNRFAVLVSARGRVAELARLIEIVAADFRELPGWGKIGRQYKSWLARVPD